MKLPEKQRPVGESQAIPNQPPLPASFCVLPFINLHISTNGSIAPCCEFSGSLGNVSTTSLDEAWNGEALKSLRRSFERGEQPRACWKCFDRERSEGASIRLENLAQIKRLEFNGRGYILPAHPRTLDIRFSNLCNFRCRTCWHGASSKWYMDARAMGSTVGDKAEIKSFDSARALIEQMSSGVDTIEAIYFAGGEPLMMSEHYALLEWFVARGRTGIGLSYNSNFSVTRHGGTNIFDLWSHFPDLIIEASVDATGARGALIRKGFDWPIFVANIAALRQYCPHARLTFGITVSVLNILTLPELIEALVLECGATADQFHLHSLQEPPHYRTQILPRHLKHHARSRIEGFAAAHPITRLADAGRLNRLLDGLQGILAYMDEEERSYDLPRFRAVTSTLDGLRSEDIKKTLPELAALF